MESAKFWIGIIISFLGFICFIFTDLASVKRDGITRNLEASVWFIGGLIIAFC
jgi:hypothetical protein